MSYICHVCNDEFKDMPALARHIKKYHPTETRAARSASVKPCPVCSFKLPYSSGWAECTYTVCPRCLSHFNPMSGELIVGPPELCHAEKAGLPCKQPLHKKYYREHTGT
jgi:DNA-directed RNA polymerase subunit RPC12/RpoP